MIEPQGQSGGLLFLCFGAAFRPEAFSAGTLLAAVKLG